MKSKMGHEMKNKMSSEKPAKSGAAASMMSQPKVKKSMPAKSMTDAAKGNGQHGGLAPSLVKIMHK